MYEDRDQRVGNIRWHRGSAQQFLDQHCEQCKEVAAGGPWAIRQFAPALLERIADFRNLKCAWDSLRRKGGPGPGPDGLTYHDYSHWRKGELLRRLSRTIRIEQFVPGPERKVRIPKGSGRGFRHLRLANLKDRVVQRGIMQILRPLLEPGFSPRSHGFRTGRNRLHALADAERLSITENRCVWICADIQDAFDNVPLQRLFQIVHSRFRDDCLSRLMERVIRGTNTTRVQGIRQGSPLSPLLLNVYVDHFLDKRWQEDHPSLPLLRYADDLLVLCESQSEAECAYRSLQRILVDAGLALKGSPATAIQHVNGETPANWLGMQINRAARGLRFSVGDSTWDGLADKLRRAHTKPYSPLVANTAISGFISQMGPVYQRAPAVQTTFCRRMRDAAHDAGFDEIPSPVELLELWERAGARWQEIRHGYE